MLESFVATQKLSVQKALRRKFRRYINAKADFNGLVLLKLQVRRGEGGVRRMHCAGPREQGRAEGGTRKGGLGSCAAPASSSLPACAPAPTHWPQECLRDARRVESITGQVEDRDNYVVPMR